jgi:hypothetical protein
LGRYLKTGNSNTSLKNSSLGGYTLPAGVTAFRPSDPTLGGIRYNTTTSNIEFYDGSSYINVATKGNVTITKDSFTGDNTTVNFVLSITPTNENNIIVVVGNVFQNPGVSYTLSGATLTFSSPPPTDHVIIVLHGFDSTIV